MSYIKLLFEFVSGLEWRFRELIMKSGRTSYRKIKRYSTPHYTKIYRFVPPHWYRCHKIRYPNVLVT